MIEIISKIFINDRKNYNSPPVRKSYGIICAACGIALNLLMFILKLIASAFTGSVAAAVDAVHNLTDSASSAVTLLSFLLSGQKKTKNFPFGKGRIEYIAGFLIAIVLITAGFKLAKESIIKIISPEPVTFSVLSVILLLISVLTKFYMAHFNSKYGNLISSAALKASATDCLCDSIATLIAAFAIISANFTSFNTDAWGGLAVSLFILFAGCKSAKDTIKMLLGSTPDKEMIEKIRCTAEQFPEINSVDSFILHDYGPENRLLCFNTYLNGDFPFHKAVSIKNQAETELKNITGCEIQINLCL
ncbi:MAG: cation transporter [Clostridia bacterium]|nr:cation transporter [Clostridia bacterium]